MNDPTFINGLLDRLHGPMSFRFLMQPLMAMLLAVRDGRRDAREGRAPYFWTVCTGSGQRRELLLSGWRSIGKVFVLAILLDVVFQYIAFHGFRLQGGALSAGVALALVPYVLLRGPVNRLTGHKAGGEKP